MNRVNDSCSRNHCPCKEPRLKRLGPAAELRCKRWDGLDSPFGEIKKQMLFSWFESNPAAYYVTSSE